MTEVEFRRWYTFALRMAHRGLTTRSGRRLDRRSRRFVADRIKEFFRDNFRGEGGAAFMGRVRSWDDTDSLPGDDGTCGFAWSHPNPVVGDLVDDLMGDGVNPHYWDRGDAAYERWDELWGKRVRCCLRSGLDMACEPSAGILGFTAGDLRRMYRGQPPAWIAGGWQKGRFGEASEPVEFAEIADTAVVLL